MYQKFNPKPVFMIKPKHHHYKEAAKHFENAAKHYHSAHKEHQAGNENKG